MKLSNPNEPIKNGKNTKNEARFFWHRKDRREVLRENKGGYCHGNALLKKFLSQNRIMFANFLRTKSTLSRMPI